MPFTVANFPSSTAVEETNRPRRTDPTRSCQILLQPRKCILSLRKTYSLLRPLRKQYQLAWKRLFRKDLGDKDLAGYSQDL